MLNEFLFNHIHAVFLFPIIVVGVCVLRGRAGVWLRPMRDIIFISFSFSLGLGYVFAMFSVLPVIIFIAPQVLILFALAIIVKNRQFAAPPYRSLSNWWFGALAFVVAIGHYWTTLMIMSLTPER